ncbi:MAG: Rpn family recombination-promoting nuclease/putative transposase [Paludibacteraceae bacterium]|nr:Rpn family recombination-promoting nuclease/putative transposase [Paludibacteraceae bacterium]
MSDPIIMRSFLNAILEGDVETITDVNFENVEIPRETYSQRGVTFDLHCTTQSGDSILIEMQNSCQDYFKTRANYYVYRLLDSKIEKGLEWRKMEKDIDRIIGIFILGEKMAGINKALTCTAECDVKTGEVFWDRHRKYFISLPSFELDIKDFTTKDIWINLFKNLGSMENIHSSVFERADEGLLRLIEKAKVGALSKDDRAVYEASLKKLADEMDMEEHGFKKGIKQGIEIGKEEGIEIGREEGIEIGEKRGERNKTIQLAIGMKAEGLDFNLIHKLTGLSLEEIEKL